MCKTTADQLPATVHSILCSVCLQPWAGGSMYSCCSSMCACQSSLLSISICKYFEKLHPYAEMSAVNRRQFPAFQVR